MRLIKRAECRVLSVLCGLLCVIQLVSGSVAPVPKNSGGSVASGRSKLLKHDRMRLIEALAQNKSQITVLLAARPRMNDAVVTQVLKLNGTVQWRDDDVDYMRVAIEPQRVPELSRSSAIESLNLAGNVDYLSLADDEAQATKPEMMQQTGAAVTRVAPPDRNTPPINPYLPTSAIGAPQFIAAH